MMVDKELQGLLHKYSLEPKDAWSFQTNLGLTQYVVFELGGYDYCISRKDHDKDDFKTYVMSKENEPPCACAFKLKDIEKQLKKILSEFKVN